MKTRNKKHPSLHGAIKHATTGQYGLGKPVDPSTAVQPLPNQALATADNTSTAPMDSDSNTSEDA
jgi:hypothetical protein